MKVSGSHVVHASRQQVWDALQDPAVLVRTIPGCHALEEVAADTYTARVHVGIASIKGTYDGRVSLSEQVPPDSLVLKASGSGGPGTIDATATVRLEQEADGDGATTVHYDADAVIGGAVGGVGQRVLAGVAKRNVTAFFSAVDAYLSGDLEEAEQASPDVAGGPVEAGAQPQGERAVFSRPDAAPAPSKTTELLLAALLGAVIALLGVAVGRRTMR